MHLIRLQRNLSLFCKTQFKLNLSPKGHTCFAFTTCRPSPKPTPASDTIPVKTNATVIELNMTDTNSLEGDEEYVIPISTPGEGIAGSEYDNSTIVTAINMTGIEAEISNISQVPTDASSDGEYNNSTAILPINQTGVKVELIDAITDSIADQSSSPLDVRETSSPVTAPYTEEVLRVTESPSSVLSNQFVWSESETNSPSIWTSTETETPSSFPSIQKLVRETYKPASAPSTIIPPPDLDLVSRIGQILTASSRSVTSDVLLYLDSKSGVESPTTMYQYSGFLNAIDIYSKTLMGSSYFYFGDDRSSSINYGLVNVALFLANAAIETVRFDICDDISWEKDGKSACPMI